LIFSPISDKNLGHSPVQKQPTPFLNLLDRFADRRIAVWGDFILDEYQYGHTRRISREAPVLILSHQADTFALGGAGNSLLNLKALGAEPIPVGVIGADADGRRMRRMLQKSGIPTDYLLMIKDFTTPKKTRILAGEENTRKQQILRIDREAEVPNSAGLKREMVAALKTLRRQVGALLISDYHNFTVKPGLFTKIRNLYQASGIPIALDSRFRILEFPGSNVCTPNEPEAEAALGRECGSDPKRLNQTGRRLLEKTAAEAVLLTRGSRGMVLFQRGRPSYSLPIHGSDNIVDVTGAGDTVISVLTLALTAGASYRQAAFLANLAGGLVVMKRGTATVTVAELKEALAA
jgi:rfaE bifunctional protein kinase chain/domain